MASRSSLIARWSKYSWSTRPVFAPSCVSETRKIMLSSLSPFFSMLSIISSIVLISAPSIRSCGSILSISWARPFQSFLEYATYKGSNWSVIFSKLPLKKLVPTVHIRVLSISIYLLYSYPIINQVNIKFLSSFCNFLLLLRIGRWSVFNSEILCLFVYFLFIDYIKRLKHWEWFEPELYPQVLFLIDGVDENIIIF